MRWTHAGLHEGASKGRPHSLALPYTPPLQKLALFHVPSVDSNDLPLSISRKPKRRLIRS